MARHRFLHRKFHLHVFQVFFAFSRTDAENENEMRKVRM